MIKRNVFERYDFARRVDVDYSSRLPEKLQCEVDSQPKDTLLSIIFSPDERTGLPTGDLNYYISDKANEDVKAFILKNLMLDVSAAKNVPNPSGLSDDALLELSRGSNETVDEYVMRMNHEIETFKFFQEQMKNQNVSSRSDGSSVSSE